MSEENLEIARAVVGEWERGNFWGHTELYAPDVEWHWSRQARAPRVDQSSYTGLVDIGQAMKEWLSEWGRFRLVPEEFIDAGDHVVVLSRIHAELKGGRGEIHDNQADVITVRDGRIVRLETFDGRADALAAVGLAE
jgi:ketosteroid isomerase-like protein